MKIVTELIIWSIIGGLFVVVFVKDQELAWFGYGFGASLFGQCVIELLLKRNKGGSDEGS